jgi:hypothetical protein
MRTGTASTVPAALVWSELSATTFHWCAVAPGWKSCSRADDALSLVLRNDQLVMMPPPGGTT